jgi:hypothetical protein
MESKRTLRTPALLRILDAAGIRFSRPYVDKEALERCIEVCLQLYQLAKINKGQTHQKKERSQLREVRDTAHHLRGLLTATPTVSFTKNHAQVLAHVSTLVSDVERLLDLRSLSIPATGLESDYIDSLAYEDHFKAKSPLQWMVGVYLCEVYEIFVGQSATGKNYVAFAYQVLKELKIKDGRAYYSPESIARAARGYRRSRKLSPRVDQFEFDVYRGMQFSWACRVHKRSNPYSELRKREEKLEQEQKEKRV